MIFIDIAFYKSNGDPFAWLHIFSLDGLQVGIGTIRINGS